MVAAKEQIDDRVKAVMDAEAAERAQASETRQGGLVLHCACCCNMSLETHERCSIDTRRN